MGPKLSDEQQQIWEKIEKELSMHKTRVSLDAIAATT